MIEKIIIDHKLLEKKFTDGDYCGSHRKVLRGEGSIEMYIYLRLFVPPVFVIFGGAAGRVSVTCLPLRL